MRMRVTDLMTDPLLRLELATPVRAAELDARITAAVMTESIDPAAHLSPGSLVMTTGMALNFADLRIWAGYVERLHDAGAAAVAFGLGAPHARVPEGLVSAARELGLPILVVPAETPFLRLQATLHRTLAAEEFTASRLGWSIADECTNLAARGQGPEALLEHMARRSGARLRIVDDALVQFTISRQSSRPDPGAEVPWHADASQEADLSIPLPLDDVKWFLQCRATDGGPTETQLRALLGPAATVLSMVLSQALESAMPGTEFSAELLAALKSTDAGAADRIGAAAHHLEIDLALGARLVVLRSRSTARVRLLTWRILRLLSRSAKVVPMAAPPGAMLLVAPFEPQERSSPLSHDAVSESWEEIRSAASGSGDSVQISEVLRSPQMLSLFTALHSPQRPDALASEGVEAIGPPQLPDVLRLMAPLHARALSEWLLAPVLESPRAADLLSSLSALLNTTTIAQAAARLGAHRNTVRAHRDELERLLGLDLSDGNHRSLCALSLLGLPAVSTHQEPPH